MKRAAPGRVAIKETHPTIFDLISYQVGRTASLMSRGAALRFKREFGVNLGEWRALALLAADRGQSMIHLSRAAGLDKAQMSRIVSSLIERNLVARKETGYRRIVAYTLTATGRTLYAGLMAAASERNDAFIDALTPTEFKALDRILGKLILRARHLIDSETEQASDRDAP